jgi:SPP1 gp7 family putative phage head morphogenesis protein
MSQALIKNVALGRSPEVLASEMRQGFSVGLQESMVLARDQQLRVYRAATDQSYRESGVVVGKRRLAARDARTCLACLAMDGELLDVDEDMYDHPQGRCTTVPVLADMPELEWQQGPQWFDTLPDTEQRAMMGDKLYEGWKADKFSFRDLATQTQHADWGKGLRVTPAGRLLEGGA